MKTLIQIPGNGDCLYNSILIGYVDAHNGQYPVINEVEIRTQHQLREIVQQRYQGGIDEKDETLITCLKGMLIDIIKLKNFSGFNKSRSLKKALENIRSKYDSLTEEQNEEEFFALEVNQYLIQLYVDSITTIWGSWQETMILRDLLGFNIRLSGQGVPEENEIEVVYVGGNHYNVYVNNSDNGEVSALIDTIGAQVTEDSFLLKEEQISRISSFSDYQLHLFFQIIFNNREAYKTNNNLSFSADEFDAALSYMQTHIIKQAKDIINRTKLVDYDNIGFEINKQTLLSPLTSASIRDIENQDEHKQFEEVALPQRTIIYENEDQPGKIINPSHISLSFQTPSRKPMGNFDFSTEINKITNTLKKTGLEDEGYYTDFDDSSGDEADKAVEKYSISKKLEELKDTVNHNSFISHAIALQLLYSPQVRRYYKPLKKKLLRNNVDIIKEPKWPIYNAIYSSLIKIIKTDQAKAQLVAKSFLLTQTDFINDIEKILKDNVRTLRYSTFDKKKIQSTLQAKCSKLFASLLSDLKKYIENYDDQAQTTDVNIAAYTSKLLEKDLIVKLSHFFDTKFSSLTEADKNILKKEEVGALTEVTAAICTSSDKTKRNKIEKLKLDDKKLSKLSLAGKAVLKTIQEKVPTSSSYSQFKVVNKQNLLKHYASLLMQEARKENSVLDENDNFNQKNYKNSIFAREGISKDLFKITTTQKHESSKKLRLRNDIDNLDIINDTLDYLHDKLAFITTSRKTLQSTHIFDFEDAQANENLFPNYLATLRTSSRSIRREIRNKEDAKKSQDYITDSVLYRYWDFPHAGSEYTEQQTVNEYLTRTDYAMFGTQPSSYPSIVHHIEQIKNQLSKHYDVKDSSIAKHIRALFNKSKLDYNDIYGRAIKDHRRIIGDFETKEINRMITRIAGLMFGTEVQRNPATLIHSQMILDLIESNEITFSDAFYSYSSKKVEMKISKYNNDWYVISENSNTLKYSFYKNGGIVYEVEGNQKKTNMMVIIEKVGSNFKKIIFLIKDGSTKQILGRTLAIAPNEKGIILLYEPLMPMAPTASTSMAVSLNEHYRLHIPYHYIHNGATSPDFSDLVIAENLLVELWREKIALNKKNIIASIQRACAASWFNIDITSRQFMIDILLEEFDDDISEDELTNLSMNQLKTLEEMTFVIDNDDLLRLHDNGDVLTLSEIIEIFQESEKKFISLAHEKVIAFYKQLQEWDEDISFKEICKLYDVSEDKLWDLINNEEEDHLISDHGLQEVSDTYDTIYSKCGGNKPGYTGYSEDGEEYNIYNRVYNRLSEEANGSRSDESSNNDSDKESNCSDSAFLNSDNEDSQESGSESRGSSNETTSAYCLTSIIYDNPELIESILYRKSAKEILSETFMISKKELYNSIDSSVGLPNNLDFSYLASASIDFRHKKAERDHQKLENKVFTEIQAYNPLFKGKELGYLNPLSNEYKNLIQEWHALESVDIHITEEPLTDHSTVTAILGRVLGLPNNLDFSYLASASIDFRHKKAERDHQKLENKVFTEIQAYNPLFKGKELGYLNPLSNEYKNLIQEWRALESLDIHITEEPLTDYSTVTAILGGVLLYFCSI